MQVIIIVCTKGVQPARKISNTAARLANKKKIAQPCCSTGGPRYMRSFYLQFWVYAIEKWPFSGTYPLIYGNPRFFYMQIHYMRAYF